MALESAELTVQEAMPNTPRLRLVPLEKLQKPAKVENEFDNPSLESFHPLKSVTVTVPNPYSRADVELNFDGSIAYDFDYYARTRDLEWYSNDPKSRDENPKHGSSLKAKYLEDKILKPMLEGTGIAARIVIMNKSETPDAFVMPDGSIFISQSVINTLDSLDEIGAVIGHELGHLV